MENRGQIYEIIADNIRKERRRLGMTQAELAERADISLDTIKSVENGRRAMSLFGNLLKIILELNILFLNLKIIAKLLLKGRFTQQKSICMRRH